MRKEIKVTSTSVLDDGFIGKAARVMKSYLGLVIFLVLPTMDSKKKFTVWMTKKAKEIPEFMVLLRMVEEDQEKAAVKDI